MSKADATQDQVYPNDDRSDYNLGDIDLSQLPPEDLLPDHWFDDLRFKEVFVMYLNKIIDDFPNFRNKIIIRNRFSDEFKKDIENLAHVSEVEGEVVVVQAVCEMGIFRSENANEILKERQGVEPFIKGGVHIRKFTESLNRTNVDAIDGDLNVKVNDEWLKFNGLLFLASPNSLNSALEDLYKLFSKLDTLVDGKEVRNLNIMLMIITEWEIKKE